MTTTYRISADCGGTFTDGVLLSDTNQVWVAKTDTTPLDPKVGTLNCISKLAEQVGVPLRELLEATKTIILGTTVATNIVATRSGAKTGAITTRGYRDRLFFLHVAKSDLGGDRKATPAELFSFRSPHPQPLVPRHMVAEVDERLNFNGEVLTQLNEESVQQAARYLRDKGVEAVAVNLLFSHLNTAHELRIEEIVKKEIPTVYVSLSSRVLPMLGEVARWSTTVFSAYVAPKTAAYAQGVSASLADCGFKGALAFMQSNGGLATTDIVCENPAALLVSGPAAGPALGLSLARGRGITDLVTTDMGGTSFDISIIADGQVNLTQKKVIDGQKFGLPAVDVNAVGAGGGSIAFVDTVGRLHVGPASAGALPGPACYGLGGKEPTVTDANLVLGYIDPNYFLGGARKLDKALAEAAINEKVANPLGISVEASAAAIHDIVNAKMGGAIEIMFSRRGCDPRDFTLCAAGGAGALHVARLTRDLGMKGFMVPRMAPVFCAYGMMFADLKHNYTRTYTAQSGKADLVKLNAMYAEMEEEARHTLEREGALPSQIAIERTMDLRYYGQVREQTISVPDGPLTAASLAVAVDRFHEKHRRVIGYAESGYPSVIARIHLAGVAKLVTASPHAGTLADSQASAAKGRRRVFFSEFGGFSDVEIFQGGRLHVGDLITGPCVIEEQMTTLVLPPGECVRLDADGTYISQSER